MTLSIIYIDDHYAENRGWGLHSPIRLFLNRGTLAKLLSTNNCGYDGCFRLFDLIYTYRSKKKIHLVED